jgi:hypothetical protein
VFAILRSGEVYDDRRSGRGLSEKRFAEGEKALLLDR